MIRIFIGYDDRMPLLYSVLSHSLLSNSSQPLSITPIKLSNLEGVFERDTDPNQSTQFSFSRFLTPYLSDYSGWSLFIDNDMVCLRDIAELWKLRDERYAVMCIKHDYEAKEGVKFLGEKQTSYPKKNWSSTMLFNNDRCRALTKDYVNSASGLELHQFKWLESDDSIGELPIDWNYLAGYYPRENSNPGLIHYTDGGPYFSEFKNCDFADEWNKELEGATYIKKE